MLRPSRSPARSVFAFVTVALTLGGPLATGALAAPDAADAVEVHTSDVFEITGSTLRNPTAGTDPAAVLFNNTGIRLETPSGRPITWGDWSGASATSTARAIGGTKRARTDVRINLSGLVPGGLYSVFWGTLGPDSEQPLCPHVERTLPLDAFPAGATAAAPNSFVAGAGGAGELRGRVDGDLFAASQVFFTVVYQFLGGTHYPFPNGGEELTQGANCRSSFGEDAMRQLLILQRW